MGKGTGYRLSPTDIGIAGTFSLKLSALANSHENTRAVNICAVIVITTQCQQAVHNAVQPVHLITDSASLSQSITQRSRSLFRINQSSKKPFFCIQKPNQRVLGIY